MSVRLRRRVLVGRDGTSSCRVLTEPKVTSGALRFDQVHTYSLQLEPGGDGRDFEVLYEPGFRDPPYIELERFQSLSREEEAVALGLCHIATILEDEPKDFDDWGKGLVSGRFVRKLSERERATEEDVRGYMAAKSYAEHRFGSGQRSVVAFDEVDQVLLGGVRDVAFRRTAEMFPDYWESTSETAPWFAVKPELLRDWEQDVAPTEVGIPLYQEASFLDSPRYQVPQEHYSKAVSYLDADPANAVKEAMLAVGSMGKILTDADQANFGVVLSKLEQQELLHPRLKPVLNKLQGYASQREGVRHSSARPPMRERAEALFVVNTAASALMMLRELDPDR